jgi:hypothetical protein
MPGVRNRTGYLAELDVERICLSRGGYVSYVCRVVGPAGAVRYLGKDFAEVEFSKDAIHWETPKDAWDHLEEFSHQPQATNLYADVVDQESGELATYEDGPFRMDIS